MPSGARSGALLAAASIVATGLNYAFLLTAGRILGPEDYGSLAALLGLLTVILLPTGALQFAVSREVSRRIATGDGEGADAFGRATVRLGLIVTAPLVALALLFVVPVSELLEISTRAVALASLGLVVALAFPIAIGVLLGYQRFHAVAALYILPFALRLALLALIVAAGYRLGGAVAAAVAGGVTSAAVAVALLREPLRRGAGMARPALGPFLRYLWPVFVGMLGIAVLTTVDLLVVKARFASSDAGEYAAAAAFARVAFFLPATILAVLFPRTAARQARGEDTADILGRSLIVTTAFCGLLTLFYAMAGRGLVHTSFGPDFADGGELLVLLTISVTLFSLANVLVGFHLSRAETRYAWIVAGAVGVQVAALALVPTSVQGIIWANIAVGLGLLAAHEVFVGSSVPAIRAGWRHLRAAIAVPRQVVVEVLLVLLGATVFVCVLLWPVTLHVGSTFIGSEGSDASSSVSWLWRLQHEGGYHIFGMTRHVLTGAPIGWDEGNGLNLQWLVPYYPAYLAAKAVGEVAAYNLVLGAGYVLSGATMYLLTRYLGCRPLVSAWAGLAYIVFPWHLERAEHASLVHLELLALLVLALVAAAERPSSSRFLLVGMVTLASWLTSGYFGVMAVVGAAVFGLAVAATSAISRGRAKLVIGLAGSAVAATALFLVATTAAGVGRGAGLDRDVSDLSAYGLRLTELIVPSADSLVLGDRLGSYAESHQHGSNETEASNYMGLLTIGLALAWLGLAWRRRSRLPPRVRVATAGLAGVLIVSLAFALPNPLSIFGVDVSWMPSRVLWEVVPAFRVPSRWVPLAMTAIVPLAALGLQAACSALARRSAQTLTLARVGVALVVVAMLVTFLELAVDPAENKVNTQPVPPQYEVIRRVPAGVLAEYPLRRSDIYTFWQREHGRPLLNGAPDGIYADDVRRSLVDPGSPGVAPGLALLGVTAIVTRANALAYDDGVTAPDAPDALWGPGYELVARFSDGSSVWRVTARSAPALVTLPSDDYALPVYRGDVFAYPLTAEPGHIELLSLASQVVRLHFDVRSVDGERRILRIAGARGGFSVPVSTWTPVSVLVAVPNGRSSVALSFEPEPSETEVELTAPWTERASGPPALWARPLRQG